MGLLPLAEAAAGGSGDPGASDWLLVVVTVLGAAAAWIAAVYAGRQARYAKKQADAAAGATKATVEQTEIAREALDLKKEEKKEEKKQDVACRLRRIEAELEENCHLVGSPRGQSQAVEQVVWRELKPWFKDHCERHSARDLLTALNWAYKPHVDVPATPTKRPNENLRQARAREQGEARRKVIHGALEQLRRHLKKLRV